MRIVVRSFVFVTTRKRKSISSSISKFPLLNYFATNNIHEELTQVEKCFKISPKYLKLFKYQNISSKLKSHIFPKISMSSMGLKTSIQRQWWYKERETIPNNHDITFIVFCELWGMFCKVKYFHRLLPILHSAFEVMKNYQNSLSSFSIGKVSSLNLLLLLFTSSVMKIMTKFSTQFCALSDLFRFTWYGLNFDQSLGLRGNVLMQLNFIISQSAC